MIDTPRHDDEQPEERDDMIAAEYVLGVLPDDERRAARDRAEVDGGFAARIADWEKRLSVFDAAYTEGPLPDLLPQIEERLFARAPKPRQSWIGRWRGRWIGWLAGGMVAAGLILAVPLFRPAPPAMQATLAGDALVFQASFDGRTLDVSRLGPAAGAGRDYELWAIGGDGVPRSLGLLRGPVTRLPRPDLSAGVTLAVSLEPAGGAPGDLPTGPILAAAPLQVL